jgi:hypothetical protein
VGKVNPDIALGGMPPFEYVCKKEERGDETLIGFRLPFLIINPIATGQRTI